MLKYLTVILLFLFLGSSKAKDNSTETNYGRLTITISNLNNNKGKVFAHLFKPKTGFPSKSKNAIFWTTSRITNKKVVIVFDKVPYGTYALTTHHDENDNGVMDTNFLGIPSEGFGISNNVKIVTSAPGFDECKFTLNSQNKEIKIYTKYL